MKKFALFTVLLFAALLAAPVVYADDPVPAAAPAVAAAHLSPADKADLARIETYLNGLKNISANFLQVDDAGGFMHGKLAISRPGKMRVDYDPPNKNFIIADGSFVHIWNNDLQSQTNVEQGTSLAEFILRDPIKLNGEVTVTKFTHLPARMEVTLVQTNDPGAGSLTLVFEDNPLQLRQWKVIDAQGHTTGVNLENMSQDVTFPGKTFFFVSPNFDKN